ncbi:MAG TPA: pseudouridine synthase [Chitinophagaceae bacterium]|nr:pseudouridine synthase [Chitinophagaceae bacterium]
MNKKNTNPSYFEKTFGKQESDREESGEPKAPKEKRDFKKGPEDRDARDRKPSRPAGERKPFARGADDRKSFERGGPREDRKFNDRKDDRKSFDRKEGGERKPFERGEQRGDRKPFDRNDDRKSFDRPGADRKFSDRKDQGDRKPFERREQREDRPERKETGDRKPYERREQSEDRKPFARREDRDARGGSERGSFDKKSREGREDKPARTTSKTPYKKDRDEAPGEERAAERNRDNQVSITRDNQVKPPKIGAHLKPSKKRSLEEEDDFEDDMIMPDKEPEKMPLNKYIAHCGVCSRRDAVELIKQGKVKVNGELATEPGMKINDGDAVSVSGKKIVPQRNLVYILLNKPKGFITTTEDDKGRRTIMDLVAGSLEQRLYPIGRLDRNTTGLIILTNDGELSQKLSHPKYNIKKVYQVTLDKAITKIDFEKILAGVELEDGVAPVDSLAMLEEKNELGIEIHSGRNRIVRRIFEHLGYQVEKLDRVMYAGLTKKNVPRGKWRLLTEREVILLKHFKS